MQKRLFLLVCITLLIFCSVSLFSKGQGEGAAPTEEAVELIFTSWRTEDIERMGRILKSFNESHPNINVVFQPISDQEYDAQLLASLETGVGADIIFLRSYDTGKIVYDQGYLLPLNQVSTVLETFPSAAKEAWGTEDGVIYGVPFVGVTHGVFYNEDIFKKYGLAEPGTWDEFLNVCQVLKDNGETVFAQGSMEGWPLYEVIYSGLGANFYGGEASRQKLMAGKMKLTDEPFVKAFRKVMELQPFFPDGYKAIDYVAMQQMFGTGQAAMYIGGSWEIGLFIDLGLENIGWFAPPLEKKGDRLQYCFHVDAGIGINKNSKNLEAAKEFIKYASTPEFAKLFMNELPGFFAYTPGNYQLENDLSKKIMDAAGDSDVTVRTVWQKMSAQAPSGNSLMEEALTKMFNNQISPEQAAEYVQSGLETWYFK